ncbi:MAG: antibiotic biosynthesis monooxygenase family protein [Gemmatimonadaceae bacterium]
MVSSLTRSPRKRTAYGQLLPRRYRVFVFISHLTVPEADQAGLEQHFRERSGLVDDFPGFLYLQLLKPQAGTATHTFLTSWTDADAFRRYMGSPEGAVAHAREPADIMARSTVRHEAYEVLLDSRTARS